MSDHAPDESGQGGLTYAVDIAICIDATGSMGPVIEQVKSKALTLPDDLLREMKAKDKHVSQLRIRIVAFRDVFVDSTPFQCSGFFTLPDERTAFESFIRTVSAGGGGDEPESGLEALAVALGSDWAHDAVKRRHVVVVWTDASAHPIEKGVGHTPSGLTTSMPTSLDELTDMWEGGQRTALLPEARRLVLFTPEAYPWSDLHDNWEEVVHFPSNAGSGLSEFEYSEILDLLAQSI